MGFPNSEEFFLLFGFLDSPAKDAPKPLRACLRFLSFPNLNKTPSEKLKKFMKFADFDTGLLFLGDIVICKGVAKKQASVYEHSLKREVCFLALHGLLHLLGFDHIKEEDEKIMNKLQDKIMCEVGL